MRRILRLLAAAGTFAAIAPLSTLAASPVRVAQDTTKKDKPVTPKQVGKNVRAETHRVGARTRDETHKIGTQTNKQAKRTGKAAKKIVSSKARHDTTN